MKLYYAKPSPFVRKVHMVAIELGLTDQVELIETTVAPGKENDAYGADVNPLRKVPALELDNGSVLVDSMVICDYLNSLSGKSPLIPQDQTLQWQVKSGHAVANGIMDAAVLIRYETFLRPEACQWALWIDEQWEKIRNALNWFEQNLGNGISDNSLDNSLSIDKIALACALGYLDFRYEDVNWRQSNPGLAQWHAKIAMRESYTATMP